MKTKKKAIRFSHTNMTLNYSFYVKQYFEKVSHSEKQYNELHYIRTNSCLLQLQNGFDYTYMLMRKWLRHIVEA